MLTLRLHQLPPVEFSPNWRGQWFRRSKAGQAAKDLIIGLVREQIPLGSPVDYAIIRVIWRLPTKGNYDYDNMVARTKPWIDGLIVASVITDDSMGHADIRYEAEYSPGNPQTIIEVEAASV